MRWQSMNPGQVTVRSGELMRRQALNRAYMLKLDEEALLQNFTLEAGIRRDADISENLHGGWESPTCQLRGHFLGHYLSACAHAWADDHDAALRGRGESIVHRLAECQREHADGWVFSIPETYLHWLERGKRVWAPQYTVHKTLMGLCDMVRLADCGEALDVLKGAADWFLRWTEPFSREKMDDILDTETGGMMEAFADLYSLTGDPRHLELMRRYERPRLYNALLSGLDPLSSMHANTTIPEMHGVMRAYEVTGEERYLDILHAYWKCAVTDRGCFATGGQTCDELWTPKNRLAEHLGPDNQEHCTVYNLIKLADFLFKLTGDPDCLDYIERNYINGILAQQHDETGMVAYYLPMNSGAKVQWGTETRDFWCCHGTLVQAHTRHSELLCYQTENTLCIAQYFAMNATHATGAKVTLAPWGRGAYSLKSCPPDELKRNARWTVKVEAGQKPLTLTLRAPWWLTGDMTAVGEGFEASAKAREWLTIENAAGEYTITMPYGMRVCALPDDPRKVAFMVGPDVLVGITKRETLRYNGPVEEAWKMLRRVSRSPYHTEYDFFEALGQGESLLFIPLRRLKEEAYTMYFTIEA